MATICQYVLEDADGNQDTRIWDADEITDARDAARTEGKSLIVIEYEYSDSSLVECWLPGYHRDGTKIEPETGETEPDPTPLCLVCDTPLEDGAPGVRFCPADGDHDHDGHDDWDHAYADGDTARAAGQRRLYPEPPNGTRAWTNRSNGWYAGYDSITEDPA